MARSLVVTVQALSSTFLFKKEVRTHLKTWQTIELVKFQIIYSGHRA